MSLTFTPTCVDITVVKHGLIEIGRLCSRGGRHSWMFQMPTERGSAFTHWHEEKTDFAAKNALLARWLDWLRAAQLVEVATA